MEKEIQNQLRNLKESIKYWWINLKILQKTIVILLIIIFLFIFYIVLDANKYQSVVHIIDGEGKVGVNPTDERLDFGDLSRGTSAARTVLIKNGTFIPMYIVIVKTGVISELTKIDKNYFKLEPRKEQKIEFSTYIPASAKVDDNYQGRVYLFKIPTFGL